MASINSTLFSFLFYTLLMLPHFIVSKLTHNFATDCMFVLPLKFKNASIILSNK